MAATNVIKQEVRVVRPQQKVEETGWDIDDLVADLEQQYDLSSELASARQWLAEGMPRDLSQLRLRKNLSQSQLAEQVGLRQPNISAIESGKRRPEYDTARKIASVLDVSTDEFYAIFDNHR